jgi:excisionase family DNA binding protein
MNSPTASADLPKRKPKKAGRNLTAAAAVPPNRPSEKSKGEISASAAVPIATAARQSPLTLLLAPAPSQCESRIASPVAPTVPTASPPPQPGNSHKTESANSARPPPKAREKKPATSVLPEYIGRKEAAALVGVCVQTIDKLRWTGLLKSYKVGRRVLISRRELLALVESGVC